MKTEIKTDPKIKAIYLSSLIMIIIFFTGLWLFEIYGSLFWEFTIPDYLMDFLWWVAIGALVLGFFSLRFPVIILNENGISTKNSVWDQSFKWDRLQEISLHSNRISVTYKQTGASDSIRIPWLLRMKFSEIDEAVSQFSSLYDVEYYSERNLSLTERSHAV